MVRPSRHLVWLAHNHRGMTGVETNRALAAAKDTNCACTMLLLQSVRLEC